MRWERNEPLWQCPTQLGKLGARSHTLSFTHRINHRLRKIIPDPELCSLEGGMLWVKSSCFFYPVQGFKLTFFFFFFLLQQFPRTSLETWASTKSFALVGNFLRQSLPGVPRLRQRRTAAGLWTLQGPQAGPRFVCLLPGRYDFS